jgi:hypothetical protein
MSEETTGLDRRRFIRNAGIGTALVWSAPAVTTLGSAHAQGSPAGCDTVFEADFEDNAGPELARTAPFSGFTVTAGNVDIIGSGSGGTSFDFIPGNGYYVDLDGTGSATNPQISRTGFAAGTYQLSFVVAGSRRGDAQPNSLTVNFGSLGETISRNSGDGPETITRTAVVGSGGTLSFTHITPPDNQGLLLLEVLVQLCDTV